MPTSNAQSSFGFHAPRGLVALILRATRSLGHGWAEKRLAFTLRRLAVALLGGRPLDVDALGARFRLHPYKNVCEKRILFTPQAFDAEERALIVQRIREGFVFVDIGANIGGYALHVAAHAGPHARILAIEPQPEVFERLTFNIGLNHFATVKALACAVTDRPGPVSLFLHRLNKGEASVKIISGTEGASVRVEGRSLLDIVSDEGFAHIDAMKLDVEGAEDLILEPYFRAAPPALWPGLIVLERGSARWSIDLPALIEAQGYRRIATTRNNLIFDRLPVS